MSETRRDAVLGDLRCCPSCHEWWPDDPEFFSSKRYHAGQVARAGGRVYVRATSGESKRCHACRIETQRESDRRARLRKAQAQRMTGYCQAVGCPVRVPVGRALCNGCAGRTVGALTPERIRLHLRAFRLGTYSLGVSTRPVDFTERVPDNGGVKPAIYRGPAVSLDDARPDAP